MIQQKTDILIIGGGIAGCIAAISLADTYHVTLVDKLAEPTERIGESLAPAAQRILQQLDLLEGLEKEVLGEKVYQQNIGMQSYWGSSQVHIVDHLRNPDGFVKSLNRKAFETYLRTSAKERGVHCIWSAKLFQSTYEEQLWKVTVKSEKDTQTIKAKFVIDATGRQSHFARNLGIKRQHFDKLIACWMTLPNQEQNTLSTISASENGWWYSAVVPENKRIVAFQTDADLIPKNELKSIDSFLKISKGNTEITKLLENCEEMVTFHGTVSANSTRLEQVSGKQWAALGDAAISFDPLSSQGMFNAMASAMQLKDLITELNFIHTQNDKKEAEFQKIYTQQILNIWEHYLQHKKLFYSSETRWKDAEFWKRRQLQHTL